MKSIQKSQFLKNIWELKFLLKLINIKSPLIIFKKCKYYTGKAGIDFVKAETENLLLKSVLNITLTE